MGYKYHTLARYGIKSTFRLHIFIKIVPHHFGNLSAIVVRYLISFRTKRFRLNVLKASKISSFSLYISLFVLYFNLLNEFLHFGYV